MEMKYLETAIFGGKLFEPELLNLHLAINYGFDNITLTDC
jgi:hypothetical protein